MPNLPATPIYDGWLPPGETGLRAALAISLSSLIGCSGVELLHLGLSDETLARMLIHQAVEHGRWRREVALSSARFAGIREGANRAFPNQ